MRKLLSIFAVAFLLAACESTTEEQATTGGEGTAQAAETEAAETASAEDTETVASEPIPGPEAGTQEHLVVNVGDRVFFEFDKSRLTAESEKTVTQLAAWLKQHPDTSLTIEGHADERGTREYNIALGARRANSVKDFLVVLGIAPNRLQTVSFGEERPAVLGSNEQAWGQNRRAVFVVEQG